MIRKFSERFQGLINEEVPRKFLKSQESRNGHLDEGDYGSWIIMMRNSLFQKTYSLPIIVRRIDGCLP